MLDIELNGIVLAPSGRSRRTEYVYGGLLCDEMGLGKTVQILGLMKNNPVAKTLILVPTVVVDTWVTEAIDANFTVFTKEGKSGEKVWTRKHKGKSIMMATMATGKSRSITPAVYITNYHTLYHYPMLIDDYDLTWNRLVCDEGHLLRSKKSAMYTGLKAIKVKHKWIVTGTPIINKMIDICSLLAFVGVPVPLARTQFKWSESLYPICQELVIHRTVDDIRGIISVAPPVPRIIDLIMPFAVPEEEEFYNAIQGVGKKGTLKRYGKDRKLVGNIFVLYMRLKQLSISPEVYLRIMATSEKKKGKTFSKRSRWDLGTPSTKMLKIREILEIEDGTKTIIFCSFTEEIKLLNDYLTTEGYNCEMYDGKLTDKQRRMTIKKARADECDVLLMQIQSGGVGINLQEFGCCIFMSPWWTSAIMNQAIARTVRMGQKSVVRIYRLQLEAEVENITYIDRLIYAKAEEKSRLLQVFFDCVDENKPMMELKYGPEVEIHDAEDDEDGDDGDDGEDEIVIDDSEDGEDEIAIDDSEDGKDEIVIDDSEDGKDEIAIDDSDYVNTEKDIGRKPIIKQIKKLNSRS
jgi:SNF2 family DNA or RNA helicase